MFHNTHIIASSCWVYHLLVFTKVTNIYFHQLWLAPVARNIQDYLFTLRQKSKWQDRSACDKIRKKINFTLYCFFEMCIHFYPNILVNSNKTTIPLTVGAYIALDIYLNASCLGII